MTPLATARSLQLDGRLHSTDLTVLAGQMVAVIGPNGGGKTSLLRAFADVDGESELIQVAGEDLRAASPARRPALMGFQPSSRHLVWPIRVTDALALGLPTRDRQRISELVDLLELSALASRTVDSLSTGERARVLFGRALASSPRLLLLDEPLSNLDPYWVIRLLEIVRDYVGEGGRSALVALHDLWQLEAFDRVLLVDGGRLVADQPPDTLIEGDLFRHHFGIERESGRFRIRRQADLQSSR